MGPFEEIKNIVKDKVEDGQEIIDLRGDFMVLNNVSEHFATNEYDFGLTDLGDTELLTAKINQANENLLPAVRALDRIKKTNLRFSQDFLGAAINQLNEILDKLRGQKINLLHRVAESSLAEKLLPNETKNGLKKVSSALIDLHGNIDVVSMRLKNIVDPSLKTPCNNAFLYKAIEAKEFWNDTKSAYEKGKKAYEIWRKISDVLL